MSEIFSAEVMTAFFQVIMIDLVLAGDNAIVIGLAAAGLPADQRNKAILVGIIAATVLRIIFASITVQLLAIVGLLLAGGILLLWVCWKMWRELAEQAHAAEAEGEHVLEEALGEAEGAAPPAVAKSKTLGQALIQILIADLTMSLDNVLAVAGAAHAHPWVMVAGLLLSIALMGVVAGWIAKLLHRFRWLGYLGLAIVFYVAVHMVWDGHRKVVIDLHQTPQYNAVMPKPLDIDPRESAERKSERK